MDFIKNIPVLIDFDGVIRTGDKIAYDAGLFFDFLESNKLPFYIISNSTQTAGIQSPSRTPILSHHTACACRQSPAGALTAPGWSRQSSLR